LEIYIFTVAKTKLKLTRSTRKALRMRIDVTVLVENTRRIFGRAREGNLGSRRIFLSVLAGHKKKKLLAGRMWPEGLLFAHPCPRHLGVCIRKYLNLGLNFCYLRVRHHWETLSEGQRFITHNPSQPVLLSQTAV
jgi:hypothetical protein